MRSSRNGRALRPTRLTIERGNYSVRVVELVGPTRQPPAPRYVAGPLARVADPEVTWLLAELFTVLCSAMAADDRRAYPRHSRLERDVS